MDSPLRPGFRAAITKLTLLPLTGEGARRANEGTLVHDRYIFESAPQQQQFQRISEQLRCLVCQNQTLADSNAPLADDLRDEIAAQVMRGESDQQILEFVVARYGDFVLYNPPLKKTTWLLWGGPFGLLLICLFTWYALMRRNKKVEVEV